MTAPTPQRDKTLPPVQPAGGVPAATRVGATVIGRRHFRGMLVTLWQRC